MEAGDKVNLLTLIEPSYMKPTKKKPVRVGLFECECGEQKEIRVQAVKSGTTKSCGCYNRKAASDRMKNNKKHGKIDHPLYQCWKSMKNRCNNKKANSYLEDISFCKEWNEFQVFYDWAIAKWRENLVLSRKDVDLDYSPDNCHFITKAEATKDNFDNEKARATCIEKYGVEYYAQTEEHKKRVKETSLEKYGTEHHTQSQLVKDKIVETCYEKYGCRSPSQDPSILKKIQTTNKERYGGKSPTCDPKVRQKQINTLVLKYGQIFPKTNKKEENEIADFLNSQEFSFVSNYDILNGKEIDLYSEQLKLGIEYCGNYWHCEKYQKDKNYHYNKYKECEKNGVRLITIFSDEWILRKDQVKNFLSSVVGINKRVFARKTKAIEVLAKEGQRFMQRHHIQGQKRKAKIYFGLFLHDEMLGCVSFNSHHRDSSKFTLDRLCFKEGYTVVGGASKLLKHSLNWCKENNYGNIISWSDNRWSQGNVYKKLGFKLAGELGPDYSYVEIDKSRNRIGKQSMTKKKMECPEGMTEKERALELGFARIWDCGKKRWELSL